MPIDPKRYETNASTDNQSYNLALDAPAVETGDAMKLVDEQTVAPTDTAGEYYFGLAVGPADPGDKVGVYFVGVHPANVAHPAADSTVSYNTVLVPSGNRGELRPINTGGATGETEPRGNRVTTTSEDADGFAGLLL